jgi:hypothetical protein
MEAAASSVSLALITCHEQTHVSTLSQALNLILPTISQDEATGAWTTIGHIQFTEKLAFTNFTLRRSTSFRTKSKAEKHIVQQAKDWIDERLRSQARK